jgi:hypothetical protein
MRSAKLLREVSSGACASDLSDLGCQDDVKQNRCTITTASVRKVRGGLALRWVPRSASLCFEYRRKILGTCCQPRSSNPTAKGRRHDCKRQGLQHAPSFACISKFDSDSSSNSALSHCRLAQSSLPSVRRHCRVWAEGRQGGWQRQILMQSARHVEWLLSS